MANIKFSAFDLVTDVAAVTEIVGYNGTQNVRITPANLVATAGPFLPLAGGTMTGDLKIIDNIQLQMGDGLDFRLYHDTNNSIISSGTGDLYIQNTADDKDILFRSDNGSGGTATYITIDGANVRTKFSKNTIHSDSIKANFGNGSDLQIYHDGSNSYIQDTGTGTLNIQGSTQVLISGTNGQVGIQYVESAGVGLRHNNLLKLLTTSTGVDITDRLDINSIGNAQLALQRTGGAGVLIQSQSTIGAVGTSTNSRLDLKSNDATRMTIATSGDVGIGTTTPATKLHIADVSSPTIRIEDTTNNRNLQLFHDNNDSYIRSSTGSQLRFQTDGGNDRMLIDTSGNVGIGTTSPASKLDVVGRITLNDNQNNVLIGTSAGAAVTTGIQNTLIGHLSGDAITTGQDNVALGYATLSGNVAGNRNVAIGRASLLVSNKSGSGYNTAIGYNSGNGITTGIQNTILGGLAGGSLTTGGDNIIIGYDSVASAVDVDNEITLGNSSIAALRCQVTSITALSDERDKTSIEDLPYGLDFVNSLQPKKFVWDHRAETRVETDEEGNETQVEFYSSNKGKKDIGFIAQELQSVDNEFTQLVYNSNPEKLEATYGRLIPVLVKAIQDLSAKVTALENA